MPPADLAPTSPAIVDGPSLLGFPAIQGEALWNQKEASLVAVPPWSGTSIGTNLTIFDYDDTLFPTTMISSTGHFTAACPEAQQLSQLLLWSVRPELANCAAAAKLALQAAKTSGRVCIVTNAANGWVEYTVGQFMPELASEFQGVPVISARSIYEPMGVVDPGHWKDMCFKRILECFRCEPAGFVGLRSVMSVGDSWHERNAIIRASQELGFPAFVKSVKLLERPSIAQIAQQMHSCANYLGGLATHDASVDFCIQIGESGLIWNSMDVVLAALQEAACANVASTTDSILGTSPLTDSEAQPTSYPPPSSQAEFGEESLVEGEQLFCTGVDVNSNVAPGLVASPMRKRSREEIAIETTRGSCQQDCILEVSCNQAIAAVGA